MKLERGHIYELEDGWACVRALNFVQEYEMFNPDVGKAQYVRLIKLGNSGNNIGKPFKMKREMFEKLVIEDHGFSLPEGYTSQKDS